MQNLKRILYNLIEITFTTKGENPRTFRVPLKVPLLVILLIASVYVLVQGVYMVDSSERGVEMTWGEVTDVTSEGLHFVFPVVQKVQVVNVEKINRETFGYVDRDEGRDIKLESYKVTKDGKVVNVFYVFQYRITDPIKWVMNPPKSARERRVMLRDIVEANVSSVVNGMTVDDVWTTGKETVQSQAEERAQKIFDDLNFGINVVQIVIQDTETPNVKVNNAFRDVNSALSEKDSKILMAKKEASKITTQTDGEVAKILNQAQSVADGKLYTVKGECERIEALSAQYNANPTLTKKVLYLDMVKSFLQKYGDNIVFIEGDNNINVLPLTELFGGNKND